jgi:hypothetical protein
MEVAVDDLADGDVASQRLRKHEGVERQQQLVVLAQLVEEDEANGDELRRLAPGFGGHAFDGLEMGFGDEGGRRGGFLRRSSRSHEALIGRVGG